MNLGATRAQFQSLLDRDDCSDTLATTFLIQGMQRLQREVRLPCQERLMVYNSDPTTATPLTQIAVPADLIQPIDIFVQNDGSVPGYPIGADVPLDKLTYRQLTRLDPADRPRAYARFQSAFVIRGTVPATCQTSLYYYGEFTSLADDTSENEVLASSPDLVIYAALSLAGDFFQHPNTQSWEDRYQSYKDQVMGLAYDADASGGPAVISPAYCS